MDYTFPAAYPFKPPQIKFTSKIWHPKINADGNICMSILTDGWKPMFNVRSVLMQISQLLAEPDASHPLNEVAAVQFTTNREEFNKTAKEWTKKHAM